MTDDTGTIFPKRTRAEILESHEVQWRIRLIDYVLSRVRGNTEDQKVMVDLIMESLSQAEIEGLRKAASLVNGIAVRSIGPHRPVLESASLAINHFADLKAGDIEERI